MPAPTIASALIDDVGEVLTLGFVVAAPDNPMQGTMETDGFTVTASGGPVTFSVVTADDEFLILTDPSRVIDAEEVVTISYDDGVGDFTDSHAPPAVLASFSSYPVTNNSEVGLPDAHALEAGQHFGPYPVTTDGAGRWNIGPYPCVMGLPGTLDSGDYVGPYVVSRRFGKPLLFGPYPAASFAP